MFSMIIQIYLSLTIIGLLVGLFSTDEQWWGGLLILKFREARTANVPTRMST